MAKEIDSKEAEEKLDSGELDAAIASELDSEVGLTEEDLNLMKE